MRNDAHDSSSFTKTNHFFSSYSLLSLTMETTEKNYKGQTIPLNRSSILNMKIIHITLLIIIPLILIEIISQSVFIFNGKIKYSIIFKPFSNQVSKITTNYLIDWDYSTNKMKPGVYTTDKGTTYTINSKGFRGKEFDIKKNKIRVLVFGGSTTIGLESPDDKTYPYQLEEILNKFISRVTGDYIIYLILVLHFRYYFTYFFFMFK